MGNDTCFRQGFSLVECLVGIAVFMIIALSVYQVYMKVFDAVRISRLKITAAAFANEQFEIIRNLSYADVGIEGGLPAGKIIRDRTITRDGIDFLTKTTIRSIDDPFDGTITSSPADLSPADYKIVEIEISCPAYRNFQPLRFTTTVAPKNLETASNNGALFIRVFDANGQPVQGANVHIENNQLAPPIIIDEISDNNGSVQIVDAPPGVEAYEITVSKSGYSTEKTYPIGELENPNPVKPHANVVLQQVTQISFAIDKLSSLNTSSISETCAPIGNIDFSLTGSKLIGANPDVFKYNQNHTTSSSGIKTIGNIEWDAYNLSFTDDFYDLAGSIPILPLNLAPNTVQNFQLIVAPKDPLSLLVMVRDGATQLPLSDVSLKLEKTGYTSTRITGRGFLRQTDWSGGEGQTDFIDPTKYSTSNGNVEVVNPAGELRLRKIFDEYLLNGELISSTFDTGSASNFQQILWQPQDQPPESGFDSVQFQIATNNDKTTWNFIGPDGTANTFYTLANPNINPIHNGDRYIRYKIFLQTVDTMFTPNIAEIIFTFTSSCIPPGQVMFSGLNSGSYTLTASMTGYQTFSDTIDILSSWQQNEILLLPQ